MCYAFVDLYVDEMQEIQDYTQSPVQWLPFYVIMFNEAYMNLKIGYALFKFCFPRWELKVGGVSEGSVVDIQSFKFP